VLEDVTRRLEERRFSLVLLDHDPASASGRGFYTNLDLGWPIVSTIMAAYERVAVEGEIWVYRPTPTGLPPSGARRP
jgi:hypothetical protein